MLLLDTNIASFFFKNDSRRQLYKPHIAGNELVITMMTVAELFQWGKFRKWGMNRTHLLETFIFDSYTILPVSIDSCRLWAEVRAASRSEGRLISVQDAWVAAAALEYQLPLVTHNPSDFQVLKEIRLITEVDE